MSRRARVPFLLLSLVLIGCAGRTVQSLDNRYEHTRLPAHFDRDPDNDEGRISLSASRTQQETISLIDSTNGGSFSFRNAAYTLDVSLLTEFDAHYLGLALGVSPWDHGLIRLGAFWGMSGKFGVFIPSFTAGLFLNNNLNNARYVDWDWFAEDIEGASEGNVPHLEIPLRLSVLVDTEKGLSPYMSYSLNGVRAGIKNAGESIGIQELTAGALADLPRGTELRVEVSVLRAHVFHEETRLRGNRTSAPVAGMRVEFVKSLGL